MVKVFCAAIALILGSGCADAGGPGLVTETGPRVAINMAALNLTGVGDVVWDLEVVNGADPAQVVWQRRLTSSTYGDSAGSASYVGPCDADPAVAENTVKVWVVGVYAGDIASNAAGTFASGASTGAGAVTGVELPFQNPTTPVTGPLERTLTCAPNADTAVQFDVALMRPAQQGFFDVAVNFNDIFCSAKFDCCTGTNCADDITLLFDSGGARARTFVLGFACTAGAAAGVDTELYMDDLALDCTGSDTATNFSADVTLSPAGAATGNQCPAGELNGCPGVSGPADTYFYQAAVYRGEEPLTGGGIGANKVYWNVALGVKAAVSACRLRTRATADDAANAGDRVDGGIIAAGTVYPYVAWDVDLGTCQAEKLTFGDDTAPVRAAYSGTGDDADAFGYVLAGLVPEPVCTLDCGLHGSCLAPETCGCDLGWEGAACDTPVCWADVSSWDTQLDAVPTGWSQVHGTAVIAYVTALASNVLQLGSNEAGTAYPLEASLSLTSGLDAAGTYRFRMLYKYAGSYPPDGTVIKITLDGTNDVFTAVGTSSMAVGYTDYWIEGTFDVAGPVSDALLTLTNSVSGYHQPRIDQLYLERSLCP